MTRALFATLLLAGCYPYTPPALSPVTQPAPGGTALPAPATIAEARTPVTILISIDGFRPDYLDRGLSPNLSRLAAGGVRGAMRPSFPSKTFPNHWTLVTGLRPDRNGIVANAMEDPARPGEVFTMASDDPFWWNQAEPIWVAAERAGIRTATMFWPGSSVAWGGVRSPDWPNPITGGTRPSDWWPFGQAVSGDQRVAGALDWLRRPAAIRPRLVTLYFDTVDTAGHQAGPDGGGTNAAIADVDRTIGLLVAGLAALNQPANLIVVADHGMAATSSERTIALDTLVPKADYRVIDTGAFASVVPAAGQERAVATALTRPHRGMTCWPKAAIPSRFHYGANPRVAPIFCLADVGWMIGRTLPTKPATGGNHGYDNLAREMRAVFVANGPAFEPGKRIDDFDNVAIEPLLRDLIGLAPATDHDGTDRPFERVRR